MATNKQILVTGGTGKTGRRIIERLAAHENIEVRIGSRSAEIPFDWNNQDTWPAALNGMDAVYIAFQPDLAVPGAYDIIQAFTALAVESGVKQLVLLSGRGEEEAQRCEEVVEAAGVEWTVVRASWFMQNFSESFLLPALLSGEVYLPVGDVKEPFVDADDIADVAVAALTEDGHNGQLYEVTGPRMLTNAEAVAEIATAIDIPITFTQIPAEAYEAAMKSEGLPAEVIWLVNYLFTTVMDGRNAHLTDGVQRALGREPRDFAEYVRETAATGIWQLQNTSIPS